MAPPKAPSPLQSNLKSSFIGLLFSDCLLTRRLSCVDCLALSFKEKGGAKNVHQSPGRLSRS
jgi:hypothetical protein